MPVAIASRSAPITTVHPASRGNQHNNLCPLRIPDVTVTWTSPEGLTHVTRPGSHLLFPALCVPIAPVVFDHAGAEEVRTGGPTMPTRAITRAHARKERVDEERRFNEAEAPPGPPTWRC